MSGRLLAGLITLLGSLSSAGAWPAFAQDDPTPTCPDPTPTPVPVTTVPIVVPSTTDDYFVLYVTHDVDGTEVEIPVLVKRGEADTTTLSENVAALPAERYRVEKYAVANPADVDGDCIDDLTELADPTGKNPVNPATAIALTDGAIVIPDQTTFETLTYDAQQIISPDLEGFEVIKFILFDLDTNRPGIYFINTEKYLIHLDFLDAVDIGRGRAIFGRIIYDPERIAPDGSLGIYYYSYNWVEIFLSLAARIHTLLAASLPLLEDNLALYIPNVRLPHIQSKLPLDTASRIPLLFDADIFGDTTFQALNPGIGMGRLRALDADDRPHPRDIVLYETLPNELPRVAGILSTVPQTPLSHVNLRAVQNRIPNAFIRDAATTATITALLDSYVRYEVTKDGYTLRAATKAEVGTHYESARPAQPQTPKRDLSVTTITPLSQVGFTDWTAFGVKAANVAELGKLAFPTGTVPTGFAIPFSFYDEFMKGTTLGEQTWVRVPGRG